MAAHRQPAYAGLPSGLLPVTGRLTDETLILPIYHQMTDEEQGRVIQAMTDVPAPRRPAKPHPTTPATSTGGTT